MNIAIILAGGIGSRVGANIPKQFIEIYGKPILAYTIEKFQYNKDIDAILVVCIRPYVDYIWELKEKYKLGKIKWVTEGGSTFQESVINGVNYLNDKVNSNDIVLVHFGASPFVSEDIISDSIRVCKEKGNAISTTDYYLLSGKKKTTKSVSDPGNYTEEYINRDTVAVMNTPHAFKYNVIHDIYKEAIDTGVINTVEPHTTTLMYALKRKIYFSKGSQTNIKITTKEDLELFKGYVLAQREKNKETINSEAVVFLANGFEEGEALLTVDLLRRAKITTVMASITGELEVKSSRNIAVKADCLAENVDYSKSKMIMLPGGRIGTNNLKQSKFVKEKCIEFSDNKYVAAICAAPTILDDLGLLNNKRATVHPDFEGEMKHAVLSKGNVVIDGQIVTANGLFATTAFSLKLIELLRGKDISSRIAEAIGYVA